MKSFELDQIKQLYCKYRCNLKDQKIYTYLDNGYMQCPDCGRDIDVYTEGEVTIEEDNACKICQWDSIINELKEFNLIKK